MTSPPPAAVERSVSAGTDHACAAANGNVRCWGHNDKGQLGIGNSEDRTTPQALASDRSFVRVSAGYGYTCGITTTAEVYCWGDNERGELGIGSRTASSRPEHVDLPQMAVQLSADFTHTCAVLSDGSLYCWGENAEGQLGQGDSVPRSDNDADLLSPTLVPGGPYQYVDAGQGHTCAIKRDGTLWCGGRNSFHESSAAADVQFRRFQQVGTSSDWLLVDAGQNHTCGLRVDRSIWCWGENTGYQGDGGFPLGIADASVVASPQKVEASLQWISLSSDTFHTCATDTAHDLWCWGRNQEGQLGLGDIEPRPTPVRVQANISSVDAGRFFGCVVDTSGEIRCAGKNDFGELGTGNLERADTFTEVIE
jgi:alpha-tubulin suppressor-like RCC1 family protein